MSKDRDSNGLAAGAARPASGDSVGQGASSVAGHTPGPWRIEGRRGPGYIISAGMCPEGDGPAAYVGVLDPMFYVAGEPSSLEADARLIAAAPDLLAALKMCVIERSEWLEEARAAIARAERDGAEQGPLDKASRARQGEPIQPAPDAEGVEHPPSSAQPTSQKERT